MRLLYVTFTVLNKCKHREIRIVNLDFYSNGNITLMISYDGPLSYSEVFKPSFSRHVNMHESYVQ